MAKYTLSGRITNRQNEPLEGLDVRAFNQPPRPPENRLGKAVTDAEGVYKINFTEKDFKPGGAEGGPDVFIRVFEGERLLGESPVSRNAKEETRIDLTVER